MIYRDIVGLAKVFKEYVETNHTFPLTLTYNGKTYNYGTIAYYFTEFIKNNGKQVNDKNIKNNTSFTGTIINESITESDYRDQVKRISQFIKQNGKLPNTVTTIKSKKTIGVKDYTYAYSKIVIFYSTHTRFPNTCLYNSNIYKENETMAIKPNDVYNLFVKTFGKITDFDSALKKIESKGYGHYFNGKLTNKQVIQNLKKKDATKPNCTDVCQMMYWIAKALGYEIKVIHVKCSSGEGHVFLKLRHKKNTENNWIVRDPACVISNNGNGIRCVWCKNGKVIDTNPSWFMDGLKK